MNLFGLSPGELLLILMVAMVVLGPEKLPEVAASAGKWIAEFRRATQELSEQFAADNPFAEIQRALQQVDQPAVAAPAEAAPAVEEATAMAAAVAEPVFAPVPGTQPRTMPVVARSDYFDRPASYLSVSDEWTHGVVPATVGVGRTDRVMAPVAEEWSHGVPVVGPESLGPSAAYEQPVDASAEEIQAELSGSESPVGLASEVAVPASEIANNPEPSDDGVANSSNDLTSADALAPNRLELDQVVVDPPVDQGEHLPALARPEPTSANGRHAANGTGAEVGLNELSQVTGVGDPKSASEEDQRP